MAAVAKNDNWIRRFEVTDPKKHKNGFTVYRVTSVVFPRSAPEASTRVVVWKRYNDFKKLYKDLKSYCKQQNICEDFPQPCKGNFFKRFEESIIKDRMRFALEFLNYIGRHQCLFTSDPFLQFFKNGHQISEPPDSGIGDDENNLDSTFNPSENVEVKRNNSGGELWDLKSSSESISVNCECSDEDSIETLDTPEPSSLIHSTVSTKDKFEICDASSGKAHEAIARDREQSSFFLKEETIPSVRGERIKSPSSVPEFVNVGTRHSENRFEFIETSLSVTDSSYLSPGSTDPEPWTILSYLPENPQDHLTQVAHHVSRAQRCELEGESEAAFCFYEGAIACLKSGPQNDGINLWREALEERAKQCLRREAERIRSFHSGPEEMTDVAEELKAYKVLDVINSVMLVMNKSDEKRYVIKVLQKSPCPVDVRKKTIIPHDVPYMIKLHKHFENESSIFLVLEYARGGKLWDRLHEHSKSNFFGSESEREMDALERSCQHEVVNRTQNVTTRSSPPSTDIPSLIPSSTDFPGSGKFSSDSSKCDEKDEFELIKIGDLEVTDLVENSQRLLNSVSKTLKNCEKIARNLSRELTDIETVFDLTSRLPNAEKNTGSNRKKGRSKSAVRKSKVEKSYSSENLATDSRPRTASSSLDRRGERSRMASGTDFIPRLPESAVRHWAAEILVALEALHRHGIVFRDLHPGNVLLDETGNVLLTYQAQWKDVDSVVSEKAAAGFYAAPENLSVFPITPAVDWWSFGALLHELLTGKTLSSCYPEGIFGHTILEFPEFLSPEASSLLAGLLKYDPGERLGSSGKNGAEGLKRHPFFDSVDCVFGLRHLQRVVLTQKDLE